MLGGVPQCRVFGLPHGNIEDAQHELVHGGQAVTAYMDPAGLVAPEDAQVAGKAVRGVGDALLKARRIFGMQDGEEVGRQRRAGHLCEPAPAGLRYKADIAGCVHPQHSVQYPVQRRRAHARPVSGLPALAVNAPIRTPFLFKLGE